MSVGETTRQPKRYTTMLATGQTRLQTSGGAAVIGIAALVVLASTMMVRAQRGLKNIPKPDVEKELAAFRVAEGFEINLFAADPMINKPTEINFDAAGRLWVASSSLYPHIKPGEVPEDRVIVLEDEDGDGRADRSTVFADGLLMPTGVEPGDGGAYVANSTELLHLADTDGDGKADRRRVMLSGFGTEDTHHILHAFRWGHDGFLYFNQSIYIHSHVETPYGVRRLNAGGVWQFRPDTLELGVFVYGMVNGWGHAFDYWGQHFGTDGAYGEGVLYFLPGASFVTAKTEAPILHGLNRGQPKYCSNEIVDGRHLPDGWQGSFITNDFRAHRVVRFVISDDGSGYSAKRMPDVLRSSHIGFRPIDVKIGPDGAIYIADWYNPIIQHGEVSFRDPRRNHVNGRIWRVTAKGRPLVERPELVGAKVETLLDHLRAPEKWTRHFAKRVLQERPANEVIPALDRWVIGLDPNDASHEHHLLEALWVRQCLRQPSSEHLTRLLRSSEPRVRAAAVRVVSHWLHALPDHLALLAAMVADDFARVRLEAVRALARVKDPRAVELAVSVLERPMDRFLDYALAGTVRELRGIWLPALQDGGVDFGGDSRHLEYALRAAGSPDVVGPIIELVRKGDVPQPRRAALLRVVAAVGSVDQMEFAIDEALALRESLAVDVLSAVAGSCAARGIAAPRNHPRVVALIGSSSPALESLAMQLVGIWKVEAARGALLRRATARDVDAGSRRAALEAICGIGGESGRELLARLVATGSRDTALWADAVASLSKLDPGAAAGPAVEILGRKPGDGSPGRVVRAFVRRRGAPEVLASALDGQKIDRDAARIALREARTTAAVSEELVAALRKAGGLDADGADHSREKLLAMLSGDKPVGDPRRGETLFRRADLRCVNCHAIGGAGGRVGPDLSSIGASAPLDYIVDSLLEPNKAVKEGFHSVAVVTSRGDVLAGIKVSETKETIVLHDADDRDVTIAKSVIAAESAGTSLMPSGLLDSLTEAEAVDLLRFLGELGRAPGFSVGRRRFARTWSVARDVQERLRGLSIEEQARSVHGSRDESFRRAYGTVGGGLPARELGADSGADFAFVRTELDVSTPGRVAFGIEDGSGLLLWVDGEPSTVGARVEIEVARGVHQVLLRVDSRRRRAELRVELLDVEGSGARARFVSGP